MHVFASQPTSVRHGAQTRTINAGESEVRFEAIPDMDGLLHFEWSSQNPDVAGLLTVLKLGQE
jgi:hypothetical protein